MKFVVKSTEQLAVLKAMCLDLRAGTLDELDIPSGYSKDSKIYKLTGKGTETRALEDGIHDSAKIVDETIDQLTIFVNNTLEEDLVQLLLDDLKWGGGHKLFLWNGAESCKTPGDALIIDNLVENFVVKVDRNVEEIYLSDSDMVVGTCKFCGKNTQGLDPDYYDGLTYSLLLELMSDKEQANWRCDSCVPCDSCDEAIAVNDDDRLCENCIEEV